MSVRVITGDVVEVLYRLEPGSVDSGFADPPYFLSGSGTTCRGGQRKAVSKGEWDRPRSFAAQQAFAAAWLIAARRVLAPTGSLWISGTSHSLPAVSSMLAACDFDLINEVTWEKPNPPPNLACRSLTHSTERILWVRPAGGRHYFAYDATRERNGGKQLKDVWRFTAPGKHERARGGGHDCQKPEALVEEALRISSPAGGRVVDLFCGSGTTTAVATRLGLHAVAVDADEVWTSHTLQRARVLRPATHADGGLEVA